MKVFTVKAFRELRELKKTATNSATNKKETLESVDYQGFQLTKVIPLGYKFIHINSANIRLIHSGLSYRHSTRRINVKQDETK